MFDQVVVRLAVPFVDWLVPFFVCFSLCVISSVHLLNSHFSAVVSNKALLFRSHPRTLSKADEFEAFFVALAVQA